MSPYINLRARPLAMGLCFLLLSACAPEKSATSKGGFEYEVREVSAGHATKGRFFFIHGYGLSIRALHGAPYATVADAMSAADFEVVYIGYPEIDRTDMTAQGATYVAKFQDWISALNDRLQVERPSPLTFIGGASMGAWHTAIAAEVLHPDVIYMHEPVTRLSVIRPFAGADTSAGDLQNRAVPSMISRVSCGTADYGVDWRLTRQLYQQLPNYTEIPGRDHAAIQSDYDDITAWLLTQVTQLVVRIEHSPTYKTVRRTC